MNNLEIEFRNEIELFEQYYNKECNPDRIKKLKNTLSEIETIEDKIQYCKDILKQYYHYLDDMTIDASGMTMAQGIFPPNTKIFFDRIIQINIDSLENKLKNKI